MFFISKKSARQLSIVATTVPTNMKLMPFTPFNGNMCKAQLHKKYQKYHFYFESDCHRKPARVDI